MAELTAAEQEAVNRDAVIGRLVSLRVQSGVPLRLMAERMQVSVSTAWRIEQQGANPTLRYLQAYGRALGVRVSVDFAKAVSSCAQCGWVGQGECPRGPGDHE